MVDLQPISIQHNNNTTSEPLNSSSSNSPTSPLPPYLPHLLYHPPTSNDPPIHFHEPMINHPQISYYYYYYPFSYWFPSSNHFYGLQPTTNFQLPPMDVPVSVPVSVINTPYDVVHLQPPPVKKYVNDYHYKKKGNGYKGKSNKKNLWKPKVIRIKPDHKKELAVKSDHPTGSGSGSDDSAAQPPSLPCGAHLAKCTSVMVKNIPNSLSRRSLMNMLDHHCRKVNGGYKDNKSTNPCPSQYDFLYLPFDFRQQQNLGYAFVNFTTEEGALSFRNSWNGKGWEGRSHKVCQISPAKLQGLEKLKRHFEGSSFYCKSEEYLPVEFSPPRNGLNSVGCKMMNIGKWFRKPMFSWRVKSKSCVIPPRLRD